MTRTAYRAGAVFTSDTQADIWQGRYELVRRTAPKTWIVEYLPDPPETADRIRAFWAHEATSTDPVWNKTWAECDKAAGERPEITGYKTREQMAEEEITARAARAGTQSTVKFISRAAYDKHF